LTVLEQLATTTNPTLQAMIRQHQPQSVTTETGVDARPMTAWGRQGGSHFKDGEFTKKGD
jgi:hypothetical protein